MAMDLFGTKAKKAAIEAEKEAQKTLAEGELLQKLNKVPLLNDLIGTLTKDADEWVRCCQGYYDDRKRTVRVEKDLFEIKWFREYEEREQVGYYDNGSPKYQYVTKEEVFGRVGYSYTKSGYLPLHEYVASNGVMIGSYGVCDLWAQVVRDRMKEAMPDASFDGDVIGASFNYSVPDLTWKDWF